MDRYISSIWYIIVVEIVIIVIIIAYSNNNNNKSNSNDSNCRNNNNNNNNSLRRVFTLFPCLSSCHFLIIYMRIDCYLLLFIFYKKTQILEFQEFIKGATISILTTSLILGTVLIVY